MVWNLHDGIDVYKVEERPVFEYTLDIDINEKSNYPVQMSFLSDTTLVSGSTNGEVLVWDLKKR